MPYFADRFEDAALGDADGGKLGIDVAKGEARQPDIFGDDAHDVVDELVVAGEPDAGEPQPFLEYRGGVGRDTAGNRATDVKECATAMPQAIGLPPENTGRMIAKSQAWVPPSKGSLVRKVSPGRMSVPKRSMTKWTCRENVPVKIVMPLVCATRSPLPSQMPQAKSSTS